MTESLSNAKHANKSYRFVQLSDLHLSSIGIPNPYRLLNKRVLGYLSWLKKRRLTHRKSILDCAINEISKHKVDHHVITGDLTHIGLKNEFEQVDHWLKSVAEPKDITVIPGNHDLYVDENWNRSFDLWKAYLTDQEIVATSNKKRNNAEHHLNKLYPVIRLRGNIAFIAVSSVHSAPWFRATGKIESEQLERLSQILSDPKLSAYCKVLLIHHPITTTYTADRKSLLNRDQLQEILSRFPVQLILHGHGHNSALEYLPNIHNQETPIIGLASSSSISQADNYKAEFAIFDISSQNAAWHIQMQSFKYNKDKHNFLPSKPVKFEHAY